MPDYLAPGVFVEEVSYRSKAIEGVGTTTAGFIGPCRYGPVVDTPRMLTSLAEFERLYGDGGPLAFGVDGAMRGANYLWHAARSFFVEGGKRLFVSRVFRPRGGGSPADLGAAHGAPPHADGHGRALVGAAPHRLRIMARHPGAMGNLQVRFAVTQPDRLGIEVLTAEGRLLGAWQGLPLLPARLAADGPEGLFDLFGLDGPGCAELPIVLFNGSAPGADVIDDGSQLLRALAALGDGLQVTACLTGGNDGLLPGGVEYEGSADPAQVHASGLKLFEAIEDIAIVAAPGAADAAALHKLLIAHAEQMRYRIALLDPPGGMTVAKVREFRSGLDSSHAALYYPWVTVKDPTTGQPLNLPPSGFVAGIYARNDTERAVYKAPANEVVRGAIGFETVIKAAEQEVLNPEGINCLRFFAGRGHRLWGARTLSSDPEWKYVNLRRYFAYLEHSIDKGTQWVVFEPNGEALWAQVRSAISDFLFNEWTQGGLLGDKPEKAFFVRCDRTTMTQNDLDNGRLVCLIGVAPLRPAEFVMLRMGQWTADRSS